jgi:hypothetical protein
LVLPEESRGVYFNSLTSSDGLALPEKTNNIYLYKLPSAEKQKLALAHPHLKIK